MRILAHLSDLHFGRHDPAIAEGLLASLEELRPDLVAVSGDFTQRARATEFAEARRFLDRIAAPKLVVPGNHDVPLWNILARAFRPFAYFDSQIAPTGALRSLYVDDEIAVLGLNTARRLTRKNGRVSLEQMDEIRHVFRDLPPSCLKILVTHHPLGEPLGGAGLELAGRSRSALAAVAQAGFDIMLSGHHHRASSGAILISASQHSILVSHAGTAVSTRTRGSEANSFNSIRLGPDAVSITAMAWSDSGVFREDRTSRYSRVRGLWEAIPAEMA